MKVDQIVASKFERGSEWRRWDLHVHTPLSKLGTSFVGVKWEDYVSALEKAALAEKIAAIGVTDYMSIEGYERLYGEQTKHGRLQGVLLIPNIELRSQPATKDGKALNIHILIDPSSADHIQKTKRALRNLKVEYTSKEGKHSYGCIREELIEFARAQNPGLEEEAAYKFGIQQFKPSYTAILDWVDKEGWLKSNSLVGISNGKDGISGLPADGFGSVRDELLTHSDFVFSGNPNDRQYYLGERAGTPPEKIKEMYGGLKPCLHGSDAHEIKALFKPDEDRRCWIKADPTFEGLRQTLWEPSARVHIGGSMPQISDQSRVIREIRVSGDDGWFARERIALNSGLVAIIGEKGAGKTAVADLIGFASGVPANLASQSSFITKGRLHLDGVKVEVEWASGKVTGGTLVDQPFDCQKPLVRYLSQDFVERLCSDDHEGRELQTAIEEVVFSHLDELQREGYSSFEELRSGREAASHSRQAEARGQIAALNREIERLYTSLSQRDAKIASIDQLRKQLEELQKQLPSITSTADATVLKLLSAEKERLKEIEGKISHKSRQRRSAEEFLKSYGNLRRRVDQQLGELIEAAQISELIDQSLVATLYPNWDIAGEDQIRAVEKKLAEEIAKLSGDKQTDDNELTLNSVAAKIRSYEQTLVKDEVNRKRLVDIQKQVSATEKSISRLTKEVSDLEGKTRKALARRIKDRNEAYAKYFEAISEDEKGLRELYAPMKDRLDSLDSEMKFELSTGYRVEAKEWLEKAARFFDGRKSTAHAKKQEIERHVAQKLVPAWNSGDGQKVRNAIEELDEIVSPDRFMEKLAAPTLKLVDLLDWLYSVDHVRTTYKIKYGGTSLEHLSPGSRGIALLVLYLLMDDDDRRPLIIDQPEGNLDNSSIYQQLVPYLRQAKENRQIVLVTHNPNLVVATDAEQIIVATSRRHSDRPYPEISYTSGALEHCEALNGKFGTRQAVCTLLEGGDRAFKEREGRYSLR